MERVKNKISAVNNDKHTKGLSMDKRILDVLVCPVCKSSLHYVEADQELICKADRLAFPVRDGMPIMLEDEAREIPATEEL